MRISSLPSRRQLLSGVFPLALAAGLIGGSAPSRAAPEDAVPVTRQLLFGDVDMDAATLSPDGKRIAFIRPVNGVRNLWVAPLDALDKAVPVTRFTQRGPDSYRWAPSGRHLLILKDVGGEEHSQLYVANAAADAEGAIVRDLTNSPSVVTKIVKASARTPGRILASYNDRDERYADVYAVDLATGERTLVLRNLGQYTDFIADNDLRIVIAQRVNPADGSTDFFDMTGAEPRLFLTVPLHELRGSRVLDYKAGGVLSMLYSAGGDLANVVEIDVKSGAVRHVADAGKADIADILLAPGTGTLLATREDPLMASWTVRAPDVAADFETLSRQVSGGFRIVSQTPDGRTWLILEASGFRPDRYYLWSRDRKALTLLASTRPALEKAGLAETKAVSFTSRDGKTITAYLTLPAGMKLDKTGKPLKPVPLVLDIHGGPWLRNELGFNAKHQWLAGQGYAALSINFRGSSGFGNAFLAAADKQWSRAMHDDLLDGVQWAIGQRVTTPDKVAIYGRSYGGYSTLVSLSFTPDVFACGISLAGPSDLVPLIANMPRWWTYQRPQFSLRVGEPLDPAGAADLAAISPITRVDQVTKPLLVVQGLNDPRIYPWQSWNIVDALAKRGKPVTYITYPDEGHVFEKARTNISFHAVAEQFLSRCLGGKARPIGRDLRDADMTVETGAAQIPTLSEALRAG